MLIKDDFKGVALRVEPVSAGTSEQSCRKQRNYSGLETSTASSDRRLGVDI